MSALLLPPLLAWAVSGPPARAGEAAGRERAEKIAEIEALPAPPFLAVGFQDRPGDCDPVEARYGRCIEVVELLDLAEAEAAARSEPPTRAELAAWRGVSLLHLRLWDDLAYRWNAEGHGLAERVAAEGYVALPPAARQWQASFPQKRAAISLPDREAWLDPADLLAPAGATWRPLRTLQPDLLPPIPDTVLLTGRFALRLGFEGRAHDYDLMDADPSSAGPLFEQLYPYRSALSSKDPALIPLHAFAAPSVAPGLPVDWSQAWPTTRVDEEDGAGFFQQAAEEFEAFSRLISVQVAQFAMQDHTDNQMRVLAAIVAMRTPPGALERTTGLTRNLVAAALGQTDSAETVSERARSPVLALEGGVSLRYEHVPAPLVARWLARLDAESPADAGWPAALNAQLRANLADLLRPDPPPLLVTHAAGVRAWMNSALVPGTEREELVEEIQRQALAERVARLPTGERNRVETWILLDQVAEAVATSLDPNPQARIAPADLVALTSANWAKILSLHGSETVHIAQGLGAVDPTAICTTRDGVEALKEPSFGAANLDLVVAAADGARTAEEVLWERRSDLPFLLVDDPRLGPPELARITGLPQGDALYRLRFRVWTGWHLLWAPQVLPDGSARLAARVAAICDDLAITTPDLVATLLRASLLHDEFRPTTPIRKRDLRRWRKAGWDPETGVDHPAALPLSEGVEFLQSIARAPLLKTIGSHDTVLAVFDLTAPVERRSLLAWSPRTPYDRTQRRAGDGKVIRSAGWAWMVSDSGAPTAISPGRTPEASVATRTPTPRWNRIEATDWQVGGGISAFPYRSVVYDCAHNAADLDVIAPCDQPAEIRGEGFGAAAGTVAAVWALDAPRLSIETGLSLSIDVLHGGGSWLWDQELYGEPEDLQYAWSFRPAAGPSLGLTFAPPPGGLWRAGSGRFPWGADRPDGTSRLGRTQGGIRAAFLLGPGYNGLEGTAVAGGWLGWSLRSRTSRNASFTPYHPRVVLGPFVQGALGFPFPGGEGDPRYFTLARSLSAYAGLQATLRLGRDAGAPAVPELPTLPEAP